MGQRRAALASLIVIALLLVPVAAATGVSVYPAHVPYDKVVDAGQTVTFEWAIYNPRNETVIVTTYTDALRLEGVTEVEFNDIDMVEPGETEVVSVTMTTDYYSPSGSNTIDFTFNITGVASGENEIVHQSATLEIDSRFTTGTNINMIFLIWENDLPPPLDGNLGAYVVTMIGWVLIATAVAVLIVPAIAHLVRRFDLRFLGRVARGLKVPIMIAILVIGSVSSLRILDIGHRTFVTLETMGDAVLIALGAWMVWVLYRETVHHFLSRIASRTDSDAIEVVEPVMDNLGKIIIPVGAVVVIFNIMGYDLTFVLAGAGITGIVLGLALQDTLSNFFSGLYLMISRPFKVGDLVEIEDGIFCQVEKVGFRNTTLLNIIDMEHFIIPNNTMANTRITNIAEPDPSLRINVQVGVEYGTDTDVVRRLLFEVAEDNPNVQSTEERRVAVRFTDFGDDSLVFQLWVWVDEARNWWDIASDLRLEIDRRFRENDIVVAFPQRTVWVNEDPRSKDGAPDNLRTPDKY